MFEDFVEEKEIDEDCSGLLPPREMHECSGHEIIEKKLLDIVESGNIPHALIFAGPEGVGKSTMAFRLARYMLGKQWGDTNTGGLFGDDLPYEVTENMYISPNKQIFKQVASGGHPDLLTIERGFDERKNAKKSIVDVDEARRIGPFLSMTASQTGGWRIVIIDDADSMNRNAQNAILKNLEEPSENTLIILVTHRPGALIDTIKSRCMLINFQPLSKDNLTSLIAKEHDNISEKELSFLYDISGGSIGKSLSLIEEGGLEAVEKVINLFSNWPNWDWKKIHETANNFSKKGHDKSYQAFCKIMLWAMESMMMAKARGISPAEVLTKTNLLQLLNNYTLDEWIRICEKLNTHFITVEQSNLDKKHGIIGAFSIFDEEQIKYG
jgi:DNA polymerase-3 subunit delta'